MGDLKDESKRKIIQVMTGEIKLSAEKLENLMKKDSENVLELAQEILDKKELLYALQNPSSREEVAEVLSFIKHKHFPNLELDRKPSSI